MPTATTLSNPDATVERAPLATRVVLSRLGRMGEGVLEVEEGGRKHELGRPAHDGLRARISVRDGRFFRRTLIGGSLGAAESFMDGDWTADDLTAVVRLMVRNRPTLEGLESGPARLGMAAARLFHALRRNTRSGSRKNIHDHYDLGNDLFERMLDPTMTYSAAVFDPPDATLEQASRKKLDLLCGLLELGPQDHLLEIGTGWGSMAIHAASRYGCRVTTTTISREQADLARRRIRDAGLEDRVELLERDYRDLEGSYSKVVSVEMIEAVGAEFYPTFFAKCASLLQPGGRLAMQAITIADRDFERALGETDFIQRYVFPGSAIPSITALVSAATKASDLRVRELRDYTPHYARTLAAWRDNLQPHRDAVVAQYGERFWRLWMYYLAYCEGGFAERYIGSVQVLFDRPGRPQ